MDNTVKHFVALDQVTVGDAKGKNLSEVNNQKTATRLNASITAIN
jgi:hypothetical protein